MATSRETVAFILDQLSPLPVRTRAMFGEYGMYCGEIFVALICDETLYIKPTAVGERFGSEAWLAPPYPGAKEHYAIPGDRLEDREWLQAFVEETAAALPPPKPKKPAKRPRTS